MKRPAQVTRHTMPTLTRVLRTWLAVGVATRADVLDRVCAQFKADESQRANLQRWARTRGLID